MHCFLFQVAKSVTICYIRGLQQLEWVIQSFKRKNCAIHELSLAKFDLSKFESDAGKMILSHQLCG